MNKVSRQVSGESSLTGEASIDSKDLKPGQSSKYRGVVATVFTGKESKTFIVPLAPDATVLQSDQLVTDKTLLGPEPKRRKTTVQGSKGNMPSIKTKSLSLEIEQKMYSLLKTKENWKMSFDDLLQELTLSLGKDEDSASVRTQASLLIDELDYIKSNIEEGVKIISYAPGENPIYEGTTHPEALDTFFGYDGESLLFPQVQKFMEKRPEVNKKSAFATTESLIHVRPIYLDEKGCQKMPEGVKRRGNGNRSGVPRGSYKNIGKHMISIFSSQGTKKILLDKLAEKISELTQKDKKTIKKNISTEICTHKNIFSSNTDPETKNKYVVLL